MGPGAPDIEMSATELSRNVEMAFNRLDTNGDGVLTRWPDKIVVLVLTKGSFQKYLLCKLVNFSIRL